MDLPEILYKEGWKFSWDITDPAPEGYPLSAKLVIDISVTDSNSKWSGKFGFVVPLPLDPKWLKLRLMTLEEHELDELLIIDGIKVFDPHICHCVGDQVCLVQDCINKLPDPSTPMEKQGGYYSGYKDDNGIYVEYHWHDNARITHKHPHTIPHDHKLVSLTDTMFDPTKIKL